MKNDNKELFDILDEALDRVLKGEDLHSVLAAYPRHADELEPLLKTALSTRDAAAITPRPEFRQRAAIEFQKAIQQLPVKTVSQPASLKPRRGIFGWGIAWSSAFAVILAVLISGTGVVAASTNAMPDSPLYSVKLAVENVQMAFTPTETGKTELLAKFNDRRVDELVVMAEQGNIEEMSVLNSRITDNMNQISDLSSGLAANAIYDASGAGDTKSSYGMSSMTASSETSAVPEETQLAAAAVPQPVRPQDNTDNNQPAAEPQVTPTVTQAPPPGDTTTSVMVPEPDERSFGKDDNKGKGADGDQWDKLKKQLSEKQIKNLRSLLEAYRNAPEDSRTEILQSIRIIILGYGLENNEVIDDILGEYGLTLDIVLS